ncbi:Ig-like domain-containing protein, partial [Anaerosporobacter sp.]
LRTKVMALAIAFTMGVSAPAAIPSMNTTTVANAATVKLNQKKISLKVGQTKQLKLTGAKKKITWSSSKKSVATVSKKGKVTAKAAGTATITAKSSGKKYTCKVTVTAKKAENNTGNKTVTLDTVTFTIPSTVQSESVTEGTDSMMLIGLDDNEHELILMTNSDFEGQQITYEQWTEMINSELEGLETTDGISDYKKEIVDTNLGEGIYVSYKMEGEGSLTMVAYQMYINEHSIGIIYMYDDTATLKLQDTFDMIIKTIAVVK